MDEGFSKEVRPRSVGIECVAEGLAICVFEGRDGCVVDQDIESAVLLRDQSGCVGDVGVVL